MENFDTVAKGFTAAIGAFVSYLIGGFGFLPVLLVAFMAVDFITGLMASRYQKQKILSERGIDGLLKKIYILFLLWCVYQIEGVGLGVLGIDMTGITGDAVAVMFLVMEFISIIENGEKMEAKLPLLIRKFIKAVSNIINGGDNNARPL